MPVSHSSQRVPVVQLQPGALLLDVQDLHYAYPDGHIALRGVTLKLQAREKVALVGPNGAGKSTFLLHLNGILRAQEGKITVAGLPLDRKNLLQIRAMVGLVFQSPDDQLFSPTVFEDVAFGPLHMGLPEEEVRRRVKGALAAVGMSGFENKLSHHLSVGQKKRIAIATVLSMQPALLVMDEPSAGLDPRARRSLIQLLQSLEVATLVATHDLAMVREVFPRMVIMDAGSVVADGNTKDLLADEALLEAHGLEPPCRER